jgi:hypothetical protein
MGGAAEDEADFDMIGFPSDVLIINTLFIDYHKY